MNWQCPRCETFNGRAEKHCEVCELAKPKRKAGTKTATKETGLSLFVPPDLASRDLPAKPKDVVEPGFKIIDRRSAIIKPVETTPDLSKTPVSKSSSSPAEAQPSTTPGGAVTDAILWLVVIGFNIYFLYDFIVRQQLGIGSVALGMIFGNLILLAVLGALLELLKWLIRLSNSTK